jgi:hypothetical protein
MFANKSDIPKNVLDSFTFLQEAVVFSFETVNTEIYLAKTKGKFIDESDKEQKVITKQVDLPSNLCTNR